MEEEKKDRAIRIEEIFSLLIKQNPECEEYIKLFPHSYEFDMENALWFGGLKNFDKNASLTKEIVYENHELI